VVGDGAFLVATLADGPAIMVYVSNHAEAARRVTVSGADLDGEYLVDEEMPDGSIVIRPNTGAAGMRERLGVKQMSPEEFKRVVAESGIARPDGEG
jgi:hypothetical protein